MFSGDLAATFRVVDGVRYSMPRTPTGKLELSRVRSIAADEVR